MKSLSVLAMVVLAGMISGAALAQGPAPAVMKKVAKDIGLNDGQIRKIEELSFQAEKEKIDLRHEVQKARLELKQVLSQEKVSEAAAFALLERISGIQLKIKKNRVGLMLKVRGLMTLEQWEKLELFQAERMRERREKRFGGGFGPGQPPMPPAPPVPPSR